MITTFMYRDFMNKNPTSRVDICKIKKKMSESDNQKIIWANAKNLKITVGLRRIVPTWKADISNWYFQFGKEKYDLWFLWEMKSEREKQNWSSSRKWGWRFWGSFHGFRSSLIEFLPASREKRRLNHVF
jgi:hypothetical protein